MKKSDLLIRFSGLKEGLHEFHFEIENKFFEQLDYSEIKKAKLAVELVFDKRPNMLILNFDIKGKVEVMCDKCTDDFWMKVSANEELICKFGEGFSIDEKIIFIGENEIELDLTQPIYELTIVSIPSKRVHEDGECNQEMLKAMDNYLMVESDEDEPVNDDIIEDEIDPRWSALKKLKK